MYTENLTELFTLAIAVLLDLGVSLIVIQRLHACELLTRISKYGLLLFNMLILFLCYTLSQLEFSFGAGLGLFALFAILRFRSEVMRITELIGLLLLLGLGFIHALFPSLITVVVVDIILVAITVKMAFAHVPTIEMKIKMKNLMLLKENRRAELCLMLEKKVGMSIVKIDAASINLEEDAACLNVTFSKKRAQVKKKVKAIEPRYSPNFSELPVLTQRKIS